MVDTNPSNPNTDDAVVLIVTTTSWRMSDYLMLLVMCCFIGGAAGIFVTSLPFGGGVSCDVIAPIED